MVLNRWKIKARCPQRPRQSKLPCLTERFCCPQENRLRCIRDSTLSDLHNSGQANHLTHNCKIGGLAEIALRVNDLEKMTDFYQTVIGLELINRSDKFVFFRIADGFAGHTQVLALFDRRPDDGDLETGYLAPIPGGSTIDHLAFAIDCENFASEVIRLRDLGYELELAYHEWVQWQSLYVVDPEGNLVELVCHDPLRQHANL